MIFNFIYPRGVGLCARILMSSCVLIPAGHAFAEGPGSADAARAQEDRIAELERTVATLAEELARTRAEIAVPEEAASLTSRYGYGPAASKVYERERGLSIGGYGEAFYTNYVSDQGHGTGKTLDRSDMLRAVLYAGYRFTDSIVFNSEIEFEHATTSRTASSDAGSVSVEFAALDFFWKPWANFRSGLLLLPVGFLNEVHEPPFFYGVNRPDVERELIPTTWRENGAGAFGQLGERLEYTLYAVNGMNARGFNASGIRGGRQNGNRALAEDLAVVGRLDWTPIPELVLGGSVYAGNSGQDQRIALSAAAGGGSTELPTTPTVLWEVHADGEWRGLHLRGLFTMTHVGDAGSLTGDLQAAGILLPGNAVATGLLGGYGELAYDVLPWLFPGTDRFLAPFYRYEWYDTQWNMPSGFSADERRQIQVHTVGVQFEPIPNVVLKLDYRNRNAKKGQLPDEVNLGIGYAF
jgi:opacity protein-like surface antigen